MECEEAVFDGSLNDYLPFKRDYPPTKHSLQESVKTRRESKKAPLDSYKGLPFPPLNKQKGIG